MADKQVFPMIIEKQWWALRDQFKKTIPSTVNTNYLRTLLNLTSDASARNTSNALRQVGLIDENDKPTARANDWRLDDRYPSVCEQIVKEVYPSELLDLFPESDIDTAKAKSWFMNVCQLGDSGAGKVSSTFAMLKSAQIRQNVSKEPKKLVKEPKSQKKKPVESGQKAPISVPTPVVATVPENSIQTSSVASAPNLHVDLQIHISPEASADQIEKIFACMAKYLYGRE